jgi:hypothetical protein
MTKSVKKLLAGLTFVGGPVETIYLNDKRAEEAFITQVGAIESFTRTAAKEASGKIPVAEIGGVISSGAGVKYSTGNPLTQVLVLRAALESKGLLHDIDNAAPGRYIRFAGTAVLSRPGLFDDIQQKALEQHPGLYEALEAERAKEESNLRKARDSEHYLWLLTLSEGTVVCPAILTSEWLRGTYRGWVGLDSPWEIFALSRGFYKSGFYKTGVPSLEAVHVNVKW